MTTTDLAIQLGVKQPTVSAYEQGTREPPLKTILAICDLFNVNAHSLLTSDLSEYPISDDGHGLIQEGLSGYGMDLDKEWGEHEITLAMKKIIQSLK